mgnify:CR=1 FL=1
MHGAIICLVSNIKELINTDEKNSIYIPGFTQP